MKKNLFGLAPVGNDPDYRMKKYVFFWTWVLVAVLLIAVAVIIVWALRALDVLSPEGWYWILLVPIILLVTIWNRRIKVPPRWEYVWEWGGSIGEPLTPGWYFAPKILGLFRLVGKVPMYDQFVNVISGSRNGVSKGLVDSHPYGTESDVEPESGAVVKLVYSLRIRCENSVDALYKMDDPFSYIALSVEKKVVEFAKTKDSEKLSDELNSHDWKTEIGPLTAELLENTGFLVLEFIPQDIINTPEVQVLRNEVGEQQLRGELLEAELLNKNKEQKIAEKDNSIKSSRLKVLKDAFGTSDLTARIWEAEVRAETIKEAAKSKNLIIVDTKSNESLMSSAAGVLLKEGPEKTKKTENKDE